MGKKEFDINEIIEIGDKIKRQLKAFKKDGYFGYQFIDYDDELVYYFYWDWLSDFKNIQEYIENTQGRYDIVMSVGQHDMSEKAQIVLIIKIQKNE